jgi:hypothetical protein
MNADRSRLDRPNDGRFRPFSIPPHHPARQQLEAGWRLYLAVPDEATAIAGGTDRIDHIIFSLLVRAWRLYRSSLALAADGFGPEAESMCRAMYEANLTALWAHSEPDEVVERFDLHLRYVFHLQHAGDADGDERVEMAETELEQARKWFGKYGERPWSGRSVRELDGALRRLLDEAGATGAFDGYIDGVHRWLNWSMHGSPMNAFRVTENDDAQRVFFIAPHERDIADALRFAGWQLILSIIVVSIIKVAPPNASTMSAIFDVWRSSTPGAYECGRNDPCPCGSGEKYKHCHLL